MLSAWVKEEAVLLFCQAPHSTRQVASELIYRNDELANGCTIRVVSGRR